MRKKPKVALDLNVKFSFFVEGSEKEFARRILRSIRYHLGSFSTHPFNLQVSVYNVDDHVSSVVTSLMVMSYQ